MAGSLTPLKHKTFAALWLAALVSNIGTWMHEVGAGWLMTELTSDPLMVSLVAASTSLPVFLFVLIAGALADILDRRKYLLIVQGVMLAFASGLTLATWMGVMTPWLLLFFTFAIGTGAAFMMPAWDAIIPEVVPKPDLPQAIALGSIGINAARAVGPAIAGFIIAQSGTYAVFALNTVSFIGVIIALYAWKRDVPDKGMAPERFVGALKAGLRFTCYTKPLQIVLARSALFFVPAIGLVALLPLYVREVLSADAQVLGYLQGSMGIGAILTAFVMPRLKRFLSLDQLLLVAAIILTGAFLILGFFPSVILACLALFAGGMAWITAFSLLRVKAQQSVPNWVRARAMSIMMMVSFGAMTLGSALWGQSAVYLDLQKTYMAMAASCIVLALCALPLSLSRLSQEDFDQGETFDHHDHFTVQPLAEEGPIQVSIEYNVQEAARDVFLTHIQDLARVRRRNCAYRWHLFQDLEQRGIVYLEQFLIESWAEHERQHARTSKDDKAIHDAVFACLQNGEKPVIRHYLHYNLTQRTI